MTSPRKFHLDDTVVATLTDQRSTARRKRLERRALRKLASGTPEQVQLIRKALRAFDSEDPTIQAIVAEGLTVVEQIQLLGTLDPNADTPETYILHGQLRAVVNLLHTLGQLPPGIGEGAQP